MERDLSQTVLLPELAWRAPLHRRARTTCPSWLSLVCGAPFLRHGRGDTLLDDAPRSNRQSRKTRCPGQCQTTPGCVHAQRFPSRVPSEDFFRNLLVFLLKPPCPMYQSTISRSFQTSPLRGWLRQNILKECYLSQPASPSAHPGGCFASAKGAGFAFGSPGRKLRIHEVK